MSEEEDPLVLFLCVCLTVGALIVIMLICGWCHGRKKGAVPSSQSVEVTVHSQARTQPDLVTPSTGQYIPDYRWQNAMETLLMRDGPYGSSPHNGSPNTNQSRLSGGTRRYQNNAMRQNSIDPPSYESLQNIHANNNDATDCSSKDLHLDSGISHQPPTSSAEAGNQNTVYQPADYEPPPPEYSTVVHYKDIYSVADE